MFSLMRKSFDMSGERGAVSISPPAEGQRRRWRSRTSARPKIGLALGAGAARGWSHIGVLRELAEQWRSSPT